MAPETNQPGFVCSIPLKCIILAGEVHLWLAPLAESTLHDHGLEKHLSLEERNKAERFKFHPDRTRYIVAHSLLRSILSSYLGVPAADLTFVSGSNGKPRLMPEPRAKNIQFNLSHSSEAMLLAVTQEREVGIDIEYIDEKIAFWEIAQQFLFPTELAKLHSFPSYLQREAFFRLWTCKEALAKAKGTGLASRLDPIEISLTSDSKLFLKAADTNWRVVQLNPAPGYVGALAVEGQDWQPRYWQWRSQTTTP